MKSDNFNVVVSVFGAAVAMVPLIAIVVWLSGGFTQHSMVIVARAWEETKDSRSVADFELFQQRYCTASTSYCLLAGQKIQLIKNRQR